MKMNLRKLLLAAILLALTVVVGQTFIIGIPWTHGNINLSDAVILLAGLLLGPKLGFLVGGGGGFLLDLISGYSQYMFFSLIVHGLEGLVCGWLFFKYGRSSLALICSVLAMVGGYFIADSFLYSMVTGILGVPTNLLQGLIGVLVGQIIFVKINKKVPLN